MQSAHREALEELQAKLRQEDINEGRVRTRPDASIASTMEVDGNLVVRVNGQVIS
jgi:hypothetical protein